MARVVAFGASYVYGHGLPDCFIFPDSAGAKPSNWAWPTKLANKLGIEGVNVSSPGASNQEILDTILNFKFEYNDIIFVMWTNKDRDIIYNSTGKRITTVAHWTRDENSNVKEWLKLHSEYDLAMRSWLSIHHAYLHLAYKEFYFLNGCPGDLEFNTICPPWADHIKFLKSDITAFDFNNPKALDNIHPGIECHFQFAESVYNEIKCK